jgi:CHAT domain-containing protein
LNNLGVLLERQGDYAAARPYCEQALAVRRKVLGDNHPDTASNLNNLGVLLERQGDYAAARTYYEEALAVRKKVLGDNHPDTASTLNCLAALSWQQGDYVIASGFLIKAVTISRRNLEQAAAAQAERQQFLMARRLRFELDNYLSLAPAARLPASQVYSLVLSWKGAVTARQRAFKQALLEPDFAPLAKQLQQTCTQLKNVAFGAPEPGKHEAWLQQIEQLTRAKEKLERELAGKSKAFGHSLREPTVEDLVRALPADAALIDFLQYGHFSLSQEKGKWIRENRLAAFIVRTRGPVEWVELGPTQPIETAIHEWRLGNKKNFPAAGSELRRLVWQPLEKCLEGVQMVLIAPDGLLNQLPFAALPGKEAGKYLIEERAVVVIPLPRLLPQMLETARKSNKLSEPTLLLLGDVDFSAAAAVSAKEQQIAPAVAPRAGLLKDWRPLPGARGEVAAIRDSFEQRFPSGKIMTLRGAGATASAFRHWAPRHQVLHLATHGFFAPPEIKSALGAAPREADSRAFGLFDKASISGFNPGLLSGIVLAGANKPPAPGQDDGILTALEVADLDLGKVELVVLSACETGLGQVAGGEGILGLQRSFQVAGAKSVVASLWKVDDDATRKLMERFYDNMWQKKLSKLEALRQAQLSMLRGELVRGVEVERTPDNRLPPFYWAAFVLSGDWR